MKRFKKLLQKHKGDRLAIAVLVLIAVITHIQWFNLASVITFGDWQYRPDAHAAQLFTAWNTWISFTGVGEPNILISGFPLRGILWPVIVNLGLTYDIATKLSLFIPVALGSFLAPYALVRYWTRNTSISFVTALFYGSTAYLLVTETAHIPIAFVYALLPLLVLVLDKALRTNKTPLWVLLSLLFSLGVYYEVRLMLIAAVLLLGYGGFVLLTDQLGVRRYFKHVALAAGLGLLLNIFWIVPSMLASAESISDVARRGVFGNHLFDLAHAFAIAKWNWTGGSADQNFVLQSAPLLLWLVPIVAVCGLMLRTRYSRHMLFFLIVSLIGIFLTKQAAEPFGGAYQWLYDNLPGFVLFREASKFYIITAFGYLGMLTYTFMSFREFRHRGAGRFSLHHVGLALIVLVAAVNLFPATTTSIGGAFKAAHKPHDYTLLDEFLAGQEEYSRTLWYPREAWWGYFDNNHPRISAARIMQQDWRAYGGFDALSPLDKERPAQILGLFDKPYAQDILNNASVQYVVVPPTEKTNQTDFFDAYGSDRDHYIQRLDNVEFLEKVDLGTEQLAVYENKNYQPPITATSNLVSVDNYTNLGSLYGFLEPIGMPDPDFYTDTANTDTARVKGLFEPPKMRVNDGLHLHDTLEIPSGAETRAKIYRNNAASELGYRTTDTNLEIYVKQPAELHVNDQPLPFDYVAQTNTVHQTALLPGAHYYLELDGTLLPLERNEQQFVGNTSNFEKIQLSTSGTNAILNPSIEEGLWEAQVGDCHNYDDAGALAMQLTPTTDGQAVQLEATRHTACTGTTFTVSGGKEHVLRFNYQSPNTERAGYSLQFNDPSNTVVSKKLAVHGTDAWDTYATKIPVPEGATSARLSVYAYETDGQTANIVRYDDFSFSQLQTLGIIDVARPADDFISADVTLLPGANEFSLRADDAYSGDNAIPHASFEAELWKDRVDDCHNYDNNAQLGMQRIDHATDGRHALQLEATRHVACTNQNIPLHGPGEYLFSFDTLGQDTEHAGYHLQFNDTENTSITERIDIAEANTWQRFSRSVKAPVGATSVQLTLYAYASDEKTPNTVRYDNFSLVKVPDVTNAYYALTSAEAELGTPGSISFTPVTPTKKTVTVNAASKPFALNFAEGFHPAWNIYLQPIAQAQSCDTVHTYRPRFEQTNSPVGQCANKPTFADKHDASYIWRKPLADSEHIQLNNFANGWVIDPAHIKANYPSSYYKENADGSLNLSFVIYYKPQSYFTVGSAIGAITFVGSMSYLIWFAALGRHRRSREDRNQPKQRGVQ